MQQVSQVEVQPMKATAHEEHGSSSLLHVSFFILTVVTGLIDAASYLAMGHVFTANMTGNVVLLAFAVTGVSGLSLSRSLTALCFALLGGAVAGRLYRFMGRRRRGHWLATSLGIETALLASSTVLVILCPTVNELSSLPLYGLIALTALSMGIRNGTIRTLGIPDITTTVLTLTVAAIAGESSLAGGTNPRFLRRSAAIAGMFLGALVGALLLRHALWCVLGAATFLSAIAAAMHLYQARTEEVPPENEVRR
jgi:uncharacterized membrane protein YoaK (UPF0700 family)